MRTLEERGRETPALLLITTLQLEGIMVDTLHAIDLGVCAHLVGNILYEIQGEHPEWGGRQEDRVAHIAGLLKKHYRDTKEKYQLDGELTLERIRKPGDWPAMRCKAAACRRMVPFALSLAIANNSGSPHDRARLGVVQLLDRFYRILDTEPMFPSTEARAELENISLTFMGLYEKLSREAFDAGLRLWKVTPKFHVFQHCLEHQSWLNPKLSWTYGDESLQGLIKEVARSCHPRTVSYMTTLKWVCKVWDAWYD